jgi:hypothetical protein
MKWGVVARDEGDDVVREEGDEVVSGGEGRRR